MEESHFRTGNIVLLKKIVFEAFELRLVWQVLKVFEKILKVLLASITTKHVILVENIKIETRVF